MKSITIKGTVQRKDDTSFLHFDNTELKKWLIELNHGEEVVINISSKRSIGQNNLFHSWVSIISNYTGEDFDTTKYWLKITFFGYREKEIDGVIYKIPYETSKMTKSEMADGMTRLYQWAQEHNIKLPNNDYDDLL